MYPAVRVRCSMDRCLVVRVIFLVVFLVFTGMLAGSQVSAQLRKPPHEIQSQPLEFDKPVQFQLHHLETRKFSVFCEMNHYVRVEIECSNISVDVSLFRPGGNRIQNAGIWIIGPKDIAWVADQSGEYEITLRCERPLPPVQVRLWLNAIRPATPEEKVWFDHLWTAHTLLMESDLVRRTADWKQGIAKRLAAINHFRAIGDRHMEAETLWGTGGIYSYRGDHQTAIQYFEQALALARAIQYTWLEATTLYYWGDSLNTVGEYTQSIDKFAKALAVSKKINDLNAMTEIVISTGESWYYLGEYQKAIEQYELALQYTAQTGHKVCEAWARNMLGRVYFSLGQWDQAEQMYARSLHDYQAVNDTRGPGVTLICLGELSIVQGNYLQGLAYLDEAFPFLQKEHDTLSLARVNVFRGIAYTRLHKFENASEVFHQALAVYAETDNRYGKARTLQYFGLMLVASSQVDEGRRTLHEALVLRRAIQDRQGMAETLFHLARLENQVGNLGVAAGFLAEAIPLIEFLRAHVVQPGLRATHLANTHEYYELYIDILMRLDRLDTSNGYAEKAFQLSEQSRARELLDLLLLAKTEIRQGIDPQLKQREQQLNEQLNRKFSHQLRLYSRKPTLNQIESLNAEIEALTRELQEVEAEIRKQNPNYAAITQPRPPSIPDIRTWLDDETALLEFQLGTERSYLWVVDRKTVKTVELPAREKIQVAIQQFQNAIATRTRSVRFETPEKRAARIAQADQESALILGLLSRQLFGQVNGLAAWKRLLIVPDGPLHYLPFAALPDISHQEVSAKKSKLSGSLIPKEDSPLVETHEIIILPSASTLTQLPTGDSSRTTNQHRTIIFADPVFEASDQRVVSQGKPAIGSASRLESHHSRAALRAAASEVGFEGESLRLPRLIHTRDEAHGIAALTRSGQCRQVLDFEANYDQATSAQLGQFSIIHFATHGFLPPQSPEFAGIVLSLVDQEGHLCDGFLGVPQIFNLQLNAELVVLSGCRTGLGKNMKGEGIVGLTRSFIYAGARRVAVSLWDIHDEATSALMIQFYREMLINHQSPAAALRAAQRTLRKSKQWASPYFWSGFILQGKYQ